MLLPSLLLAALSAACAAPAGQRPTVTTPSEYLGRPLAADSTLADWSEVSSYFQLLARQSPRVRVQSVGRTTQGRDFLLAAVSSEANLARLDELRAHAARLADPRGASPADLERALSGGLPILMISSAMHSTETAAPQFAMRLAHELATSDAEPFASARERALVLILPCTNPDGLDAVVSWYRRTLGTPFEASGMTELYQRYAGHDNNRDWFMLSLEETRLVTRLLYVDWHPTVYWDVHQQGQSAERMFVPPFRDPLNPNLDPAIITGIGLLGARALHDMTAAGFTGVSTGVTFDMWWNGGNRNVPVRHNIVGLLTEAASVDLATPIFLKPGELRAPGELAHYAPSNRFPAPWPGGWWRLSDIVEYEMAFARSLCSSLSSEPRFWLENALGAAQRAIAAGREGAPKAWILPADNPDRGALARLVSALAACGVEFHRATTALQADGRTYPSGSLVILRDQPYGAHVKDLMEVQRYPEGEPPYDVAGWTLPFLLGVERAECVELPRGTWEPARDLPGALETPLENGGALDPRDTRTWKLVFSRLARGESVAWTGTEFEVAGQGGTRLEQLPRVGLYAPWAPSMDEGWTRWVLESVGLPFATVRNERLRAGGLREDFDVLVIPDVSPATLERGRSPRSMFEQYTGGLAPEGAVEIEEFVREGGRVVAWEGGADWAVELFGLPLVDVTRGKEGEGFSCPGSVVRIVREAGGGNEPSSVPASLPVFFAGGRAWREAKAEEKKPSAFDPKPVVRARYAPAHTLLSGWIKAPEKIGGKASWVRADLGAGSLHLFGFSPVYRSWTQGSFQLLFRAILLPKE
jgi:hypothetical protein